MTSSGFKRGLATTAVSAMAVTGLPFFAGAAHAAPLTDGMTAGDVTLYSLFSGKASTENDGQNSTVSLAAGAASNVNSVTYSYSINGTDYFPIGTATRNAEGTFELEWAAPANLQGSSVTVRAQGFTSNDGSGTATDSETRTVQILNPAGAASETVELSDTSPTAGNNVKVFQQPYGGSNSSSYAYVEGTTSATDGTVAVSVRSQGLSSAADAPVAGGAFTASLDVTGYPFENLDTGTNQIVIGAERVTDDAEGFTMTRQVITTVDAGPDQNAAVGQNASVTITVTDQDGDPVRGAQVYDTNGNRLIGYTDAKGQVKDTAAAAGDHTYYANTTADPSKNASDPSDTMTVSPYVQQPTTATFTSGDGNAFDLDEYTSGDMFVVVKDQNGNPVAGRTVQYKWDVPNSNTDVPATGFSTATTDANGKAIIDFPTGGGSGNYVLTYQVKPDAQGNGGIAAQTATVDAGQAALVLSPADAQNVPAGTSQNFVGTLALPDGTPLPNRLIDASFARGTEEAPGDGTADAGIVDKNGNIVLANSYVTDNNGQVTITVKDKAEDNPATPASEQGSETGGVLTVETGNTVATNSSTVDGDAGASDSAKVDFVSAASIGDVTLSNPTVIAVDGNTQYPTPGRPEQYTVHVSSDTGTSLANRTVTIDLSDPDAIMFATDTNGDPVAEGPNAESGDYKAAATKTVVTDANGDAIIVVGFERDSGFDDDGQNPLTVKATSDGESDSDTSTFSSGNDEGGYYNVAGDWVNTDNAEPLHAGSVDISLASDDDQESTVLPKARTDQDVYFDLVTKDQFGNRAKQDVDLSDGLSPAGFDNTWSWWTPSNTGVSQFTTEDPAIMAFSNQATTQAIKATWTVSGFGGGTQADAEDDVVTDTSETITWYVLDLAASSYTMDDDTGGEAQVGETVTMTVTAVDQEGQPIQGLDVEFVRSGPNPQSGDVNYQTATDADGVATYNFKGDAEGTATVSAVIRSGNSQVKRLEDSVTFTGTGPGPKDPINPVLLGANNGKADDVLTVNAESEAQGTTVKLFKIKKNGKKVLVGEDVLNKNGDRKFTVNDANGNKFTKYVAKVMEGANTLKAKSNVKRVR